MITALLQRARHLQEQIHSLLKMVDRLVDQDDPQTVHLRAIFAEQAVDISEQVSWLDGCRSATVAPAAMAPLRKMEKQFIELGRGLEAQQADLLRTLQLTGRAPAAVVLSGPEA